MQKLLDINKFKSHSCGCGGASFAVSRAKKARLGGTGLKIFLYHIEGRVKKITEKGAVRMSGLANVMSVISSK
ncbi:MAG: hypothetical protein KQH63_02150 [Desulfobulbaceae bacterium]|nr:hypothetical protein [Desulfobulbaceae bacterium]